VVETLPPVHKKRVQATHYAWINPFFYRSQLSIVLALTLLARFWSQTQYYSQQKINKENNKMLSRVSKVSKHVEPILWDMSSQAGWQMLLLIILNITEAGVEIASPWILFEAISHLMSYQGEHGNEPALESEIFPILMLGAYVACWGFSQIAPTGQKKLTAEVKSALGNNLVLKIIDVSAEKSLEHYQLTPMGEIAQTIFSTFGVGTNYVTAIYQGIIPSSLKILGSAAVIGGLIDWKLSLSVLFTAGTYCGISYLSNRPIPELEKLRVESQNVVSGKLLEVIANYESMHFFNNKKYEMTKILNALITHKISVDASDKAVNRAELLRNLWLLLAYLGIIPFAAHQFVVKQLGYNEMVMLIFYLIQLAGSLNSISGTSNQLSGALAQLEKVIDLINAGGDIKDLPGALPLMLSDNIPPAIDFLNVSLISKDGKKILDDVTLKIKGGQTVALVGISGSGKSTIGKILFRFVDPTAGKILINNHEITDFTIDSVRRAIGIVPQHPVLFNDTLENNVRYGNPAIKDRKSIVRALQDAELWQDIQTDRLRLGSFVGEGGSQLSGGQLQRVAIARLLLKNPKIRFLGEVTSALDFEAGMAVTQTLTKVTYGYTTIIVTHELSLVVNADCIYVFDQGKIVEQGTFDDLLAKGSKQEEKESEKKDSMDENMPLVAVPKGGYFFRMFKAYSQQLGQTVENVVAHIPREKPKAKLNRSSSKIFDGDDEFNPALSINISAEDPNEKTALLGKGKSKQNSNRI